MSLPVTQLVDLTSDPAGSAGEGEAIVGLSPTQLAVRRFRKDKLSMISLVITVIYTIGAIAAPLLVKFNVLKPYTIDQSKLNPNLGGIPNGRFGGISSHHLLGIVPGTGGDVLARCWYGITFSLMIALSATILAVGFGTIMGIIGGTAGGRTDWAIGRFVDLTLAFPQTLMLLALSSTGVLVLAKYLHGDSGGPGINALYEILVLAVFGWPSVARLVRGQVLSIREREFIDAAILFGASRRRLYFKEILPNLWAPLLVTFTLTMPVYVSTEAALSFLGVGIHPPTPTLGNVLGDSVSYASADFTYFFIPAALIALIVVTFNLLGDGIGDALNPRADR